MGIFITEEFFLYFILFCFLPHFGEFYFVGIHVVSDDGLLDYLKWHVTIFNNIIMIPFGFL